MMSKASETPCLLSPSTAAETTRVGSSSWQRRTIVARYLRSLLGHRGLQLPSSLPIDQMMIEGELR